MFAAVSFAMNMFDCSILVISSRFAYDGWYFFSAYPDENERVLLLKKLISNLMGKKIFGKWKVMVQESKRAKVKCVHEWKRKENEGMEKGNGALDW